MKEKGIYAALGAASSAYAKLLDTAEGKEFADEYTWASVVLGVGMVLLALRFVLAKEQWRKVFRAFAVAGGPMIARSLRNRYGAGEAAF